MRQLVVARVSVAEFMLDQPVTGSGDLASDLREGLGNAGIPGSAYTVPSADAELKNAEGFIATSDSAIIDYAGRRTVYDLARHALQGAFSASFPDLRRL